MKKNVLYIIIAILIIVITSANSYAFYLRLVSDNVDEGADKIHFGIYDEIGRYTGYDFSKGTHGGVIRQSMGFSYGSGGVDSFGEGAIVNYLDGDSDANAGTFKLLIYGQRLSIYRLNGVMRDVMVDDTGTIGKLAITGLIDVGQIRYIEIKYTPDHPVVTRIATPSDLITDITTAQKLNLIGNPKFVAELIEDIDEIEKKRAKMLKNASRSSTEVHKKSTETYSVADNYQEILQDITEAYTKPTKTKFVTAEGYNVLKEDIEYIITH